jgi:hypothetical protein
MSVRLALAACVSLLASACGRLSFEPVRSNDGSMDDGSTGDATERCKTFGAWSMPALQADLSSDDEEYGGGISADGKTLFFPSDRPGGIGGSDLYMTTYSSASQSWSPLQNLTSLNSSSNEENPSFSDDQLTLYFASDRSGPYRLYTATRASPTDAFGAPSPVVADFTGLAQVGGPEPSHDHLTLYFDAGSAGAYDIFSMTRASMTDPWGTPSIVSGLSVAGSEGEPTLEPDELTIYFVSDMFEAPQDLVVATRPDKTSPFGTATKVPLGLALGIGEYGADISADGLTMELSIHAGAPLKTNVFLSTRSCLD